MFFQHLLKTKIIAHSTHKCVHQAIFIFFKQGVKKNCSPGMQFRNVAKRVCKKIKGCSSLCKKSQRSKTSNQKHSARDIYSSNISQFFEESFISKQGSTSGEVLKMVFKQRYKKHVLLVPSVSYHLCFKHALKRHMKKFHQFFQRLLKTKVIAHTTHKCVGVMCTSSHFLNKI